MELTMCGTTSVWYFLLTLSVIDGHNPAVDGDTQRYRRQAGNPLNISRLSAYHPGRQHPGTGGSPVYIQNITYTGSGLEIPVDDTVSSVTVRLQTDNPPPPFAIPMLPGVLGLPVPFAPGSGYSRQTIGSTVLVFQMNISKPGEYGNWKFTKLDPAQWHVTTFARSPITFTHVFLGPGPGGQGQYPVNGNPIAGEHRRLQVTVPNHDKVQIVNTALIIRPTGRTLRRTLTNLAGRRNKAIFYTDVTIPDEELSSMTSKMIICGCDWRNGAYGISGQSTFRTATTLLQTNINCLLQARQDFYIAIEGVDNGGHVFRRQDPTLISPTTLRLFVPHITNVKLYKNEALDIPYTVYNAAAVNQDILIRIHDNRGFLVTPAFSTPTIVRHSNHTETLRIRAGSIVGQTVSVTIKIGKPYVHGKGFPPPEQTITRHFIVQERLKKDKTLQNLDEHVSKATDSISPTCMVRKVTGTCNLGSDLCKCSSYHWTMEVEAADMGFGLREMFPTGAGSNIVFHHDNFTAGVTLLTGSPVKASLRADCCHQNAAIHVVDMANNVGECTASITPNFKPPDAKVCNNKHPNITVPCKNITTTGTCNFGPNPCDCQSQGWHIRAEFGTVGLSLYSAFSIGAGNNATIQRTGAIVEMDSDCCHQQITIVGTDIANNVGECNISLSNFKAPNITDCTTTLSTTTTTTTSTTTTTPTTTTALSTTTTRTTTTAPSTTTTPTTTTTPSTTTTPTTTTTPSTTTTPTTTTSPSTTTTPTTTTALSTTTTPTTTTTATTTATTTTAVISTTAPTTTSKALPTTTTTPTTRPGHVTMPSTITTRVATPITTTTRVTTPTTTTSRVTTPTTTTTRVTTPTTTTTRVTTPTTMKPYKHTTQPTKRAKPRPTHTTMTNAPMGWSTTSTSVSTRSSTPTTKHPTTNTASVTTVSPTATTASVTTVSPTATTASVTTVSPTATTAAGRSQSNDEEISRDVVVAVMVTAGILCLISVLVSIGIFRKANKKKNSVRPLTK